MLKINQAIQKSTKRYFLKNTVNAKCDRSANVSTISALGLAIQTTRLQDWQISDIGITSILTTTFLKSLLDWFKNEKDLILIKKRAKAIKKSSKI